MCHGRDHRPPKTKPLPANAGRGLWAVVACPAQAAGESGCLGHRFRGLILLLAHLHRQVQQHGLAGVVTVQTPLGHDLHGEVEVVVVQPVQVRQQERHFRLQRQHQPGQDLCLRFASVVLDQLAGFFQGNHGTSLSLNGL
ncbi:TOBE domain-containing protein [Hydrogenophaga taeniospiralis]|uniref:TOBE domain-containing protein n=1 Tax=Hydrogenophaga taeniospiralis TaxID=65656 RepID=UPI0039B0C563